MNIEHYKKILLEIFNSDKFDREAFGKLNHYDTKQSLECIAGLLQAQYMDINVENILANHSRDEITDFLNRLIHIEFTAKDNWRREMTITADELEEFKKLSSETDKILKTELSKNAPVLTVKTYMEMCRVAYDAMYENIFPPDISTAYIFCSERMLSFEHEYERGIFGADFDSPDEFALNFTCSYHNEELEFGGMTLYIHDESALISEGLYTSPEAYKAWTGYIHCNPWRTNLMCKSIKAYNALRKKQYPIYFSNSDKVYSAAKELVNK